MKKEGEIMKTKLLRVLLSITIAICLIAPIATFGGCIACQCDECRGAGNDEPPPGEDYPDWTSYGSWCYGSINGEGVDFRLWIDDLAMHLEVLSHDAYYISITENETNVLCNRMVDADKFTINTVYEYFYDPAKFYEVTLCSLDSLV